MPLSALSVIQKESLVIEEAICKIPHFMNNYRLGLKFCGGIVRRLSSRTGAMPCFVTSHATSSVLPRQQSRYLMPCSLCTYLPPHLYMAMWSAQNLPHGSLPHQQLYSQICSFRVFDTEKCTGVTYHPLERKQSSLITLKPFNHPVQSSFASIKILKGQMEIQNKL